MTVAWSARTGFFVVLMTLGSPSSPTALTNASARHLASPAARATPSLTARVSELQTENKRLRDELSLLQKFVPRDKGWWEANKDVFLAVIFGLLAGPYVAYRYTKVMARSTLTMEMIKQWLDAWADGTANGVEPLQQRGLDIDQANIRAINKLGNLYEIMSAAVLMGIVDVPTFRRIGIQRTICRFRERIRTEIDKISATPSNEQKQVHDILERKLKVWNESAELCKKEGTK